MKLFIALSIVSLISIVANNESETGLDTNFSEVSTEKVKSKNLIKRNATESGQSSNQNVKPCYQEILCNSNNSNKFTFDPEKDIKFVLLREGVEWTLRSRELTRRNSKKKLVHLHPTKIIIHGFFQSSLASYINKVLTNAYINNQNVNVITGEL